MLLLNPTNVKFGSSVWSDATSVVIDRSGETWIAKIADHKTVHHGKERVLYFGPHAQLILTRYLSVNPTERLFAVRRDTYSKAVAKACDKLKLPHWSPHWLRHTAASRFREEFGLESAQVLLGHAPGTQRLLRHEASLEFKVDESAAADSIVPVTEWPVYLVRWRS